LTKSNIINFLSIFLLGVASSFSLPPYNYFFLNFLTFSLFFIFLFDLKIKNKSLFKFFLYGWLFGFGYFLSNLYWISFSLLHDPSFSFLTPISIILIPAFMALFYGFATVILRYLINVKNLIISVLFFSIVLSLVEYLRGFVLSGFPWNLIAYSFSEQLEFIQINSIIGIYSFNLICITIFLIPSVLILRKNRKELIFCIIFILIPISFFIYGFISLKNNSFVNQEINKKSNIVLLSTNISLERFYSSEVNEINILNELISLSEPKKYKDKETIFIWPEGILPNTDLNNIYLYGDLLKENFGDNDLIILGVNREDIQDDKVKYYNTLAIINNNGNVLGYYDKSKLVPFGEFLPLENILLKVGLKNLTNNYQSYSKGKKSNRILSIKEKDINFLALICYEIIFSGNLSDKDNFDFIVNISEDGWFGSSIGPYQHFSHSIFRSIEVGKYIFRSTNNGISAIVDPNGRIVSKIDLENEGVLHFENYGREIKTIYSQHGNKMFGLIILIYIFLILSFMRVKNE